MTTVRVFDPAMCCSTGICGPSVDPQLVRFAADLDWLRSQGATVERFNLSQQPGAFAEDRAAKAVLETKGEAGLPLVAVNGEVKSSGGYPSRDELAAWAGVGAPAPSIFTEAVAELVAIGAAIASKCEPCFKFHYDKARKLGVSREDMLRAVVTGESVLVAPVKSIVEAAMRDRTSEAVPMATAPGEAATPASSSCCGSSGKVESSSTKSCC